MYDYLYTGLFTIFFNFTAFSHKAEFIKTLIDRTFKINNNWQGFQNDFTKFISTLTKNKFPLYPINRIKKFYLSKTNEPSVVSSNRNETTTNRTHFKLTYIGTYLSKTQKKLGNIIHSYCNNTGIKLVVSTFKISKLFSNKDKVPNSLKSHVIYLLECEGCKARYIAETNRHLQTKIYEHLQADRNSQIFKHLKISDNCRNLCNSTCFKILDIYQLKLK